MKLEAEFYQRKNVVKIARALLGKVLFTNVNGVVTSGMIVETEAYSWKERGCHAYDGKRTDRNAVMFERGGYAYVYLCYGIHHLFNVVTNVAGVAEAVLIRAVEPVAGIDVMRARRGERVADRDLTSGPGKLTKALGIDCTWNGKWLVHDQVWIEEWGYKISSGNILASARIGIDYAGSDARLPWRFSLKGNKCVSK